ncbi:MAG: hypothetical protein AAF618_00320 [Pseudomonadota bacterium]
MTRALPFLKSPNSQVGPAGPAAGSRNSAAEALPPTPRRSSSQPSGLFTDTDPGGGHQRRRVQSARLSACSSADRRRALTQFAGDLIGALCLFGVLYGLLIIGWAVQ